MSYTVLARKYRSQTYDEVVGQDPIAKTLKNAIRTDRVAHAYLFTGTRGVGKTTMARVLAKSLNCLAFDAPTTEPCCKCDSCTAINLGEDIDVIEIDGATNNGVEQVRQLRENAIYRPARSRFKIYIIDEVHMLTVPAFNALLKTLEEPPAHVKFIFATTEPNKVIPTIQSRCQRFDFKNISVNFIAGQLKQILKKENIKYKEDLILLLAKMANGSMRDALSLLDRLISTGEKTLTGELLEEFLGQPNSEKIYNLIGQIGDNNAVGTLAATEDLMKTGLSEIQIADALIDYMRDIMVTKSLDSAQNKTTGAESDLLVLTAEQKKHVAELAEKFDIAALVYNITALEKLRWTLKNSDTPRALLEATLLRFALSEHFLNIDELMSRMQGRQAESVKKKDLTIRSEVTESIERPHIISREQPATNIESQKLSELPDIQSIKTNWQNILEIITTKLGNGTAGLLRSAEPAQITSDVLTLEFNPSAKTQKEMCESSSRAEQIKSVLSEYLGREIKLHFQITNSIHIKHTPSLKKPSKSSSQMKNQIINDPAVKTVLLGLNATITDIEEDPEIN